MGFFSNIVNAVKGATGMGDSECNNQEVEHFRHYGLFHVTAMVSTKDIIRQLPGGTTQPIEGSAFAVGTGEDKMQLDANGCPLLATSEHLVKESFEVSVQVPFAGEQKFAVGAVLKAVDLDLSLLQFEAAACTELKAALASSSFKEFKFFPIDTGKTLLQSGNCVCSVGFPVGNEVTTSGAVTGGDEISTGGFVISHDAAMSIASGGGPLITCTNSAEGVKVVGVNFAIQGLETPGAENNNYAVQGFKLGMMLNKYNKNKDTYTLAKAQADPASVVVQVPPIDSISVTSTAMMAKLIGCDREGPDPDHGPIITKVNARSAFKFAEPPMPESIFQLQSVRGVDLDMRGDGNNNNCFEDAVPFRNLILGCGEDPDTMKIETCQHGKVTEHTVSLAWRSEFEPSIPVHTEESLITTSYVKFCGMVFQDLSQNLALELVNELGAIEMVDKVINESTKPFVVVTVTNETAMEEIPMGSPQIMAGDQITHVNDKPINSIADFKAEFASTATGHSCAASGHSFAQTGTKHSMWSVTNEKGQQFIKSYSACMKDTLQEHDFNGGAPSKFIMDAAVKVLGQSEVDKHLKRESLIQTKQLKVLPVMPVEMRQIARGGRIRDFAKALGI